MKIIFQEYNGNAYALNPRIERDQNQLSLTFDEQACSHFLLFTHRPGDILNLREELMQEQLYSLGENLLSTENQKLSNTIAVRCIPYHEYRMINNRSIKLAERIAGYTIFGCQMMRQYDPEQFHIILPQAHMSNYINVSVDVPYRISYVPENDGMRGAYRHSAQAFYVVQFEDVDNYQDGAVVYTLDNMPIPIPITKEMLGGKKLYIDAGMGAPKFQTAISGFNLKKL